MKTFLPLLFLLSCVSVDAQNLPIITYNLLAWSESNKDGRTAQMQKTFTAINLDIVVMQEVVEETTIHKSEQYKTLKQKLKAIANSEIGIDADTIDKMLNPYIQSLSEYKINK